MTCRVPDSTGSVPEVAVGRGEGGAVPVGDGLPVGGVAEPVGAGSAEVVAAGVGAEAPVSSGDVPSAHATMGLVSTSTPAPASHLRIDIRHSSSVGGPLAVGAVPWSRTRSH
ncbi:hypothetical protein AWW66_08760 [Micromonospora rosaria]|uniref:Uncharacterized protein n=1 Tax=Micromonospora rosaria TaxID=47874 RepID=A0A136PVC6_9ACTN|nr:hypothetical protein AWW66_08760 [Micromonospora rosaria]